MSDRRVKVVLSTAAGADDAERIARHVVEGRLAACVNIVSGVTSVYRWQGAVERSAEVLLVFKTRADLVERLRAAIVSLHAYEVPEVLELDVAGGHSAYLDWVLDSCRTSSEA